jgi:arginine-tRNA-protein transferase
MFIDPNYISSIAPVNGKKLDYFLSRGFYRIGDKIFTTNYVVIDAFYHDVFWLRTNLSLVGSSKTIKQCIKNLKPFSINFKPATITQEAELLFKSYCSIINFDFSESIAHYLLPVEPTPIFDTRMIEVRDNGKLIALGYFDVGHKSIAGIMNMYHPDYKKYSLGKCLMWLKMNFAMQQNMDYYYTGYISLQSSKFDYKLFPNINAVEVFLPKKQEWQAYNCYNKDGLAEIAMQNIF